MITEMFILFCFEIFNVALGKLNRIIGGSFANIAEYPYQVGFKIINLNLFICGGALVTQQHILSAAHCFKYKEHLYNDIRAFTGTNFLTSTENLHRIIRFDLHPQYTSQATLKESHIHDISVVTLEKTLTFSRIQNKVNLPTDFTSININAIITGWGKTQISDLMPSNELRKIIARIISKKECQTYFALNLHFSQMCATQPEGTGTYQGDSGGPLVVNGKVVGILSWIVSGVKNYPDIYTDVYAHINFINSILQRPV